MHLCVVLLIAMGVQAQTLRIGTWDQKSDTLTGGGEAILAQAYAELKQPVEFVELPSRRAMVMMLGGELDGNVFASRVWQPPRSASTPWTPNAR